MMTISESQYSSNQMSSIHKINDRIVHQDSYNDVQQSSNVNSGAALVTKRGFKPSDMFDPKKKEFLTNLSYKLFPVSWNDHDVEGDGGSEQMQLSDFDDDLDKPPMLVGQKDVDLNKIFTPAPDADQYIIKKSKKGFASSDFYVAGLHPTAKEQMELARAISRSLSDSSNQMSKGQSMYVNRKKRSVKWVHEGKGRNTSNTCVTPTPTPTHDTPYRPHNSNYNKPQSHNKYGTYPKPALKQTNNPFPKMEPFPTSAPPTITIENYNSPIIDPYVSPVLHTKLNDAYSPSKFNQWNGKSYNTAPRGWGEVQDYYRPVILDDFGKTLPYTDY